ncbi:hypothetical protein H0H93_004041 [Arthromyces matolae]|nr:hypothetical protein H0H93_004041 [Arthromyces matolae]
MLTGAIKDTLTDSLGPIRCAAVDSTGKYLATAGDSKVLKLYSLEGLRLINERELPKRPTSILLTQDAKNILVSDKFGDIFSYAFDFTPLPATQKRDDLSSHENPSGGTLVLGHASLLNAFLLTKDEKFIITADRDEHIRISWYPQGYTIEMFCLGHTKYVSAIHIPTFAPQDLVSGGGDPVLKIWDWMNGKVKREIEIWDVVERYIRVKASRRKRGEWAEEEGSGKGGKRKARGKKSKGKGKKKEETKEEEEGADDDEVGEAKAFGEDEGEGEGEAPATAGEASTSQEKKGEKVLVISKIATTSSKHIVFSAVGASALFVVDYTVDETASAEVRAFELGQPVLGFELAPQQEDQLWVTLDGNWSEAQESTSVDKPFIVALDISKSGELVKSTSQPPVVNTLSSKSSQSATSEQLKNLELYIDLVSMPKGHEPENDQDGEVALSKPEKQTKRTLGRLKNKQKVIDKEKELATLGDDDKEPAAKKARSDAGESPDVNMEEG